MFKTDDFIFRRSVLGEAMDRANIKVENFPNPNNYKPTAGLVREPRIEVVGKNSYVVHVR